MVHIFGVRIEKRCAILKKATEIRDTGEKAVFYSVEIKRYAYPGEWYVLP